MTKIEQLKDWIQSSDNIVFFGGAGVSTESGIPDFRGTNGLYRQGGIKVENMTMAWAKTAMTWEKKPTTWEME